MVVQTCQAKYSSVAVWLEMFELCGQCMEGVTKNSDESLNVENAMHVCPCCVQVAPHLEWIIDRHHISEKIAYI